MHISKKLCVSVMACAAITLTQITGTISPTIATPSILASAADSTAYDWSSILKNSDSWFKSNEAISIADDIIKYQNSDGGWKKVMEGDATGDWAKSTIDNDGTTSEIRVLARVYKQTGTEKYKTACMKGIDLLINSQYANGGWPQCFGVSGNYHAHITYNDEAMLHVLEIMKEMSEQSGDFTFVDNKYAEKARNAMDKGVQCILDTQIIVNGVRTAWCQQHDSKTLEPASARAYELPSISAKESVGLVNFMLSLDNPSREVIDSINAAIVWMQKVQLNGIKIVSENGDKKIVEDSSANPLWARFYEIDTNKPMFVDRDGSVHYDWTEISQERRTGYSWYGEWPKTLVKNGPITTTPAVTTTSPKVTTTTTTTTTTTVSPIVLDNTINITESSGWFESAYVEWDKSCKADSYNVYYKKSGSSYMLLDGQLVREYKDYFRADAVGLADGDYVMKIVPVVNGKEVSSSAKETGTLHIERYLREGFAFSSYSPNGTTDGAYNADGTLKSNANVIYLTNENKDTVTINDDKSQGVGITEILNNLNKAKSEQPLAIRIIGKVEMPADVANYMLAFQNMKNVTIEGIGEDATVHGWGLSFKRCQNFEVRNLGIMWYGGVGGDGDGLSLDTENKNFWVHNCDFFYGAPGKDADQVKGDGAIDLKTRSDYITLSYCHFWDSGKALVSGGVWESKNPDDPEAKINITYHHNWFDHSDSRHPRCVAGNTHVYNNYYDGVAKYGVGAAVQSSVFVENNYFRNVPRPMLIASQGSDVYSNGTYGTKGTLSGQTGGMIKEYGNTIVGAKRYYDQLTTPDEGHFDAYKVSSRDEKVPSSYSSLSGGSTYNNFDTADTMYSYNPDSAEEAVVNVKNFAGRMNGGDFKFTFSDSEDTNSDIIPELQKAVRDYQSSIVSIGGESVINPPQPEIMKGDVNDDGEFNISDVVMLQKWLLAVPDVHLANWEAGDLCQDDRLDVFDLCLMKRELIKPKD